MSNGLDPNQAQCFVGHDQGPNCSQSLSVDGKISLLACKELRKKGSIRHRCCPVDDLCIFLLVLTEIIIKATGKIFMQISHGLLSKNHNIYY